MIIATVISSYVMLVAISIVLIRTFPGIKSLIKRSAWREKDIPESYLGAVLIGIPFAILFAPVYVLVCLPLVFMVTLFAKLFFFLIDEKIDTHPIKDMIEAFWQYFDPLCKED